MSLSLTSVGDEITLTEEPNGQLLTYKATQIIGNGSFGVVFRAKILSTNETVAIKKVLQDRRFKSRELQLMRACRHPNLCRLYHCFYSEGGGKELYLNLVLEYIPENL